LQINWGYIKQTFFNNLGDIPSYPDLKDLIIFSTSLEETNFKFIFGKGVVVV
jgi:hypothetical protein